MNKIVWLALRYTPLEVLGVFDNEEDALVSCESENDVVGPVEMNIVLPSGPWTGAYYPHGKDK